MIWFTSDWHLGEDRLKNTAKPNVFYRPFTNTSQNDSVILGRFIEVFQDGDTLYHLGDVAVNKESIPQLKFLKEHYPNSKFILIVGNYDEDKLKELGEYFEIYRELFFKDVYLNHYPEKCINHEFSYTGHIHGLWKVQKNMINVSVDAWHFNPVSLPELEFCRTAINKFYDKNVFPYT